MKYVRTKDGKIYAFYDIKEIGDTVIGYVNERDKNALDGGSYFNKKDIRIADTIEELCDEYVLGETKYHKPCVTKLPLDFLKECVATKTHYELVVYGAIWTDKGLIYVAKMNEKGELELL